MLPYSVFVRRRMTKGPGSSGLRYLTFASHSLNIWRSSAVGCASRSAGGMSWATTLATAFFHW